MSPPRPLKKRLESTDQRLRYASCRKDSRGQQYLRVSSSNKPSGISLSASPSGLLDRPWASQSWRNFWKEVVSVTESALMLMAQRFTMGKFRNRSERNVLNV